jgi:hypothetical protein
LIILTAVFAIGLSILVVHGSSLRPQATEVLWTFEFRTLLAIWVRMDRNNRSLSLPFEFDAFVFFAWPVAVPYYLYRIRGWRGLFLSAAIYGLYVTPEVIAAIVAASVRLALF